MRMTSTSPLKLCSLISPVPFGIACRCQRSLSPLHRVFDKSPFSRTYLCNEREVGAADRRRVDNGKSAAAGNGVAGPDDFRVFEIVIKWRPTKIDIPQSLLDDLFPTSASQKCLRSAKFLAARMRLRGHFMDACSIDVDADQESVAENRSVMAEKSISAAAAPNQFGVRWE